MRRLLVALALLLCTAACGAYRFDGAAQPSPSPGGGIHFDVVASEKDRAVTMRSGQTLEVVLHGGTSASWQQVRSSDTAVLRPTPNPAATAPQGVTLAAFRAEAPGRATVTAVGTPVCASGQACPMYAILYTLSVRVTP